MNARGEAEERLEGGHRRPPPVEAEGELVEVGLEVIVPAAVVGAAEPGLEVPEDAMDVRQQFGGSLGQALGVGAVTINTLSSSWRPPFGNRWTRAWATVWPATSPLVSSYFWS